jgi:hypothetical protein
MEKSMTTLREAAQQALEALEPYADIKPRDWKTDREKLWRAFDALRAALAEPYDQTALELCEECGWKTLIPTEGCLNCERQPKAEQEPVGFVGYGDEIVWKKKPPPETDLYTVPQPRKRLTDQEIAAAEIGRNMK